MTIAAPPGAGRARRLNPVRRDGDERVMPLELFFDLVFVLAVTQCTTLMYHHLSAEGVLQGLLVLGVLWWSWVGYAWFTSVVDPEDGPVKLALFAAMAALVVAALCVPNVFGHSAGLFAGAYAVVRGAQIVLFVVASREDPGLRHSVVGLAISTAVGVGLLVIASFTDGGLQIAIWALALAFDMGGPLIIESAGWRLSPHHFAERHGLIILIALGESIVAIGTGATVGVDAGVVAAAVTGVAVAAALFLLYFDVVALVAARRLERAPEGRERNEIARDSFSYLHFPMVAGIVLVSLGVKKTLGNESTALHAVPAAALLGGTAVYLLAHVAFRWRNVHRFSSARAIVAVACIALVPLAATIPALISLGALAAILIGLVAYEHTRFAELRTRLRREVAGAG